ncbi:MAG: DUF1549 domain-containing protein [Planctomycetes bacterium]|nr:DUF1549 domain-containing protein [Planctomycetota bacterium]
MSVGASPSNHVRISPVVLGVFLLLFVGTGWAAFRALTRTKEAVPVEKPVAAVTPPPPSTPTPPVPAPPTATTTTKPVAPEPRPTTGTPDETPPEMPVAVAAPPEPDLDNLVKKEAPKYGADDKPKGELVAVVVKATSAREPKAVAAEIDRIIDAKLTEAKIPASPQADDAEFHRRIYLDITGCVPPIAKVQSFLADRSPDKRAKLIDELLASHDYGDHFAHYWHELIVKRDPESNNTIQTHDVFLKWMTRQLNQNRPWNEAVRALLTAEGDQALAGETFFILANSENGQPSPNKLVGTAAALFLGNQLQCAECHIHPMVSTWKQKDFWGLAAFFGKTHAVRNGNAKNPNDLIARIVEGGPAKGKGAALATLPDGSIAIPDPRNEGKTIGVAKAKLFGDGFTPVAANSVSRGFVGDWFVSPTNPYFPRASVNRIWSVFLGRGLINPLDDIRPESKASHPELLEMLSAEFIASKFDVKHMIRSICNSAAYQRTSKADAKNKDDEDHYSHMALKVIPPRALFASLAQVTDHVVKSPREDHGGKKGEPANGFGFFDNREYDESPTEYTYGVPQLLRLMNTQLPPACDAVAKSLPKLGSKEKTIEHLYLLALGRLPTAAETEKMGSLVAKSSDPAKGYSAALWVLLHTAEFFTNH